MKNEEQIISQSSREVYELLLEILKEYHKMDARKLAHYLSKENRMPYEGIGNILGMTGEAVRQKYFADGKGASK